jgi:hypothetical protein
MPDKISPLIGFYSIKGLKKYKCRSKYAEYLNHIYAVVGVQKMHLLL